MSNLAKINYIKEYTGKIPNSIISKRLKVTKYEIEKIQEMLKIDYDLALIQNDFISIKNFAEYLGLESKDILFFIENEYLESFDFDGLIVLDYNDLPRMEKFLSEYIEYKRVIEILNIPERLIEKKIFKNEFQNKIIGNIFFIKKDQVIEYKKILRNTYSIQTFSKITKKPENIIFEYIYQDKINYIFHDGMYRIYKSQLEKFLKYFF